MLIEDTLKKAFIGKQIKSIKNHDGIPVRNLKGMIVADVNEDVNDKSGKTSYFLFGNIKGNDCPVGISIDYKTEIEWVDYAQFDFVKVTVNGKEVEQSEWIFLDIEKEDLMDVRGGTRSVLTRDVGTVVVENVNAK